MMYVDVEASTWQDEFGKHIRYSIPEHGVAVELNLIPTEDEDAQASVAVRALNEAPAIISRILELAIAEYQSENE